MIINRLNNLLNAALLFLFCACSHSDPVGTWDFELELNNQPYQGQMKIHRHQGDLYGSFKSLDFANIHLDEFQIDGSILNAQLRIWDEEYLFTGEFSGDRFHGELRATDEVATFYASRQSNEPVVIDRSQIEYVLSENDLPETELGIDHAGIIEDANKDALERGARIYNSNCINCHGNTEIEGSIPLSLKFWEQPFKAGHDPYSMYQTVSRGVGTMPPQPTLTPQEKYDVITYIRETFIKQHNQESYFKVTAGYLSTLPVGTSRGPEPQPYHPWSDQNYGDFFINTYELVDDETGIERYHSPRPVPFADEDYSRNNFAYKGIAVRVDPGPGGVSKGRAWMIFDHDLMRVAGGWTGKGFIDWDGILLNDRHETYPRTTGKLHFETPVGPGWANPVTGSFEDPRFKARDGRQFGPLPKKWANYLGLYHHGEHVVISYTVGTTNVLEELGIVNDGEQAVFTRTLNLSPSANILKLRVAPVANQVQLLGSGAYLVEEDGFHMMQVERGVKASVKLFIADQEVTELSKIVAKTKGVESLAKYTRGGPAHYPEIVTSTITMGSENGMLSMDQLTPPFENPWNCRMKLSGIDFMSDGDQAVVCTTDGDVWLVSGMLQNEEKLSWQRIGAGLFQPLGIKVIKDLVYVICRDQIVLLRDYNGDRETDFYQSFNHDHQVTDHFHEFAMGLQADAEGNLYYAKSGRHAREALIPQHGTLIKVSPDGSNSEIIATGFRAANGVCLNPDGSFLVTDQQGYWNPMNRINWISPDNSQNFYGNMWGYDPPKDTSRTAMVPPMVWVDMEFDRSPSELLWVNSDRWGPLNGALMNVSYGYGKIQLVLYEEIGGQKQGGVIDIPGLKFYTGVMRGRFNQQDGNLYLCGMSAWGSSQNMRAGDLYRIRYTGNSVTLPLDLEVWEDGLVLTFDTPLKPSLATNPDNYQIRTWDLIRSSKYGSDRHNPKTLDISSIELQRQNKSVKLTIPQIEPVDIMTINYNIENSRGEQVEGTLQNTIHNLRTN